MSIRPEYSELVERIYHMLNESAAKWEERQDGSLVRKIDYEKLHALPYAFQDALHCLQHMGLVGRDDVLDAVCEDSDALREKLG
jgi:hypothetical protein